MTGETRQTAWAAALYAICTIVFAWPLSGAPGTRLLSDDPDGHLYVWTMGWNAWALATRPLGLFDANIFHPERLTLAYSENLIGTGLFAAPVLWLTDNPVLALNLALLVTPVLCGVGAYVLARQLGLSVAAAVVCGLVFAFSPARFFRLSQPHVTAVQWLPFMLAFLHAYADRGRPRDLRLAIAAFSMQALTTGHGAAFAIVAVVVFAAWRLMLGEPWRLTERLRDVGVPGALALLPAVALFVPYRLVQDDLGLRRSLVDWAPSWESFLASPSTFHTWLGGLGDGRHVHGAATAFLFPGIVPVLLAALAIAWRSGERARRAEGPATRWSRVSGLVELVALAALAVAAWVVAVGPIRVRVGGELVFTARDPLRAVAIAAGLVALRVGLSRVAPLAPRVRARWRLERWRAWAAANRARPVPFYACLTGVGLLLSMGPPLGIGPLVYWLPGLSFIRAPSRFMVLVVLGLAVLAAVGVERLSAMAGERRRGLVTAAVAVVFLAESIALPMPTTPFDATPPAVDRWLDTQPKPFVVAEVPVYPVARSQTVFMLHAMAHWQKTVHGYSGTRPRLHEELYALMRAFPHVPSLDMLSDLGVTHVVVHRSMYEPAEWDRVATRLETFADRLELVHEVDGDRVYQLRD